MNNARPKLPRSSLRSFLLIPLLALALALAHRASAAIYMNVEGIKGEVTAEGYADWIEVTSFQFGVGRAISSPTGGGTDREASPPSFSEITATKEADKTSPLLLAQAALGQGKVVELHFTRTVDNQPMAYQKIKLYNTMFSGFSQSSGGDRPSESLSLNYTKIEFNYIPIDNQGQPGTAVSFIYDIALGRVE